MIDWSQIQDVLHIWFHGCTELQVLWENEKAPFIDPQKQAVGRLRLSATSSIGVDEFRFVEKAGPPAIPAFDLENTISGIRQFTLTCDVESQRQEPNSSAPFFIEKARTGLRKAATFAVFRKAGLSVVRTFPTINLDRLSDDRMSSRRSFDVIFQTAMCERDVDLTTIETTELTTDYKDATGTSFPASLQLTDEVIP